MNIESMQQGNRVQIWWYRSNPQGKDWGPFTADEKAEIDAATLPTATVFWRHESVSKWWADMTTAERVKWLEEGTHTPTAPGGASDV